jgi:hypothetical protein
MLKKLHYFWKYFVTKVNQRILKNKRVLLERPKGCYKGKKYPVICLHATKVFQIIWITGKVE